ncbi:SHOCT domain-containing protein [Brachybacterium sacelli]|uniref:Membrane protein n=1 Tax=Brachybacterium sacelli TaxID=173364 RepID=A0ABS4X7E3_9MICO|nr:SHOCT domain-containing protein [Brachybacterium sacelli]MBP2384402.1 putative membrane protein [Brachybacterium sacelli]
MMPTDAMSWLMWAMVAGLVVLLWAPALLLARTVLPGRPRRTRDENEAIGELSLRLARGEISVDEFEQQRQLVMDVFRPQNPPLNSEGLRL